MNRSFRKFLACLLAWSIFLGGLSIPEQTVRAENAARITTEEQEAQRGEEVMIPVSIADNPGIMGFVMNIEYDPKCLEPIGVEKGSLLKGTFDYNADLDNQTEGFFEVLWSGTADMKQNGILFELHFRVKDRAKSGSTAVQISYNPADTFNEAFDEVALICENAAVFVQGEELPEITENRVHGEPFSIYADASISVPVTLENNTGLMGFLITVKYDPKILEAVSVETGELIPNGTMFDDTVGAKEGEFKVLWSGNENRNGDGCLFTLNFRAAGQEGSAEITLEYSQADTFDEKYRNVALVCEPVSYQISKRPQIDPKPDSARVIAEDQKVRAGEEMTVPVWIENNPGIQGFVLEVTYDANCLEPIRTEQGTLLDGTFQDNLADHADGVFEIIWDGAAELTSSGRLLDLYFRVKEDASAGNTTVGFSVLQVQSQKEVAFEYQDCHVQILKKEEPGVKTARITTENAEAERGAEVIIPVSILENPGIMGFVINIEYDPKCLEPVRVEKGALLEGKFDHNLEYDTDGFFEVLWSGTSEMGLDGRLFDICFRVKERAANGNTTVKISYNPEDTFDEEYHDVELVCEDASIFIQGEELPDIRENRVYAAEGEVRAGEDVKIPVNIEHNTGIMGFLITVKYDPKALEAVSVEAGELIPDGTMFDDTTGAKEGELKVLWSGNENRNGDGCLFYLNFHAVGQPGDTELMLEYSQEDTFDERYRDVVMDCEGCSIHILENGPVENEENKIYADSAAVTVGESIKIPVRIAENTGIMGFGIIIQYDPDTLRLASVQAGELLPEETLLEHTADTPGVSEIVWKGTGNVTENGCLFYLNFDAIGQAGDTQILVGYRAEDTVNEANQMISLTCSPFVIHIAKKAADPNPPTPVPPTPNPPKPNPPTPNPPKPNTYKPKVSSMKLKSVKKKGKKKLEVKWNVKWGESGYQLQYALNKKFTKGKKTKNFSWMKSSYVIKGLKAKKTYFVRIRAYTKYHGKKYYGKWSPVKSCKTK